MSTPSSAPSSVEINVNQPQQQQPQQQQQQQQQQQPSSTPPPPPQQQQRIFVNRKRNGMSPVLLLAFLAVLVIFLITLTRLFSLSQLVPDFTVIFPSFTSTDTEVGTIDRKQQQQQKHVQLNAQSINYGHQHASPSPLLRPLSANITTTSTSTANNSSSMSNVNNSTQLGITNTSTTLTTTPATNLTDAKTINNDTTATTTTTIAPQPSKINLADTNDDTHSPFPTPVLHLNQFAPHPPYLALNSYLSKKPFPKKSTKTNKSTTAATNGSYSFAYYRASDSPRTSICRFRSSCIRSDGTILLHASLQGHLRTIKRQCPDFRVPIEFADDDFYNSTDTTTVFDMFSTFPVRFHIPHYLTDVMPFMLSSFYIFPSKNLPRPSNVSMTCVASTDGVCEDEDDVTNNVHTALYAEERLMRFPLHSWVNFVTHMLHNSPYMLSYSLLFGRDDPNVKKSTVRCFRSIVSTPRVHRYQSVARFLNDSNPFYAKHNLRRRPTRASEITTSTTTTTDTNPSSSSSSSSSSTASLPSSLSTKTDDIDSSTKVCRPNIMILDRNSAETQGIMGRNIVFVRNISREILSNSTTHIQPRLQRLYFEDMTFAQQVDSMQRAHVLVGVHGAGLSNMIFSRMHTPLLELYPYSYYPDLFQEVAQVYSVNYSYVVSHPDDAVFWLCMRLAWDKARGKLSNPFLEHTKRVWKHEHAHKGNMSRDSDILDWNRLRVPEQGASRACARSQRLIVNVHGISKLVWGMIEKVCDPKTNDGYSRR